MNKIILLAILSCISGCVIQPNYQVFSNKRYCEYVERDLTATWNERSYWCLPYGSRHTVIRQEVTKSDATGVVNENVQ